MITGVIFAAGAELDGPLWQRAFGVGAALDVGVLVVGFRRARRPEQGTLATRLAEDLRAAPAQPDRMSRLLASAIDGRLSVVGLLVALVVLYGSQLKLPIAGWLPLFGVLILFGALPQRSIVLAEVVGAATGPSERSQVSIVLLLLGIASIFGSVPLATVALLWSAYLAGRIWSLVPWSRN